MEIQSHLHRSINDANIKDVYYLYHQKFDAFDDNMLSDYEDVCLRMLERRSEENNIVQDLEENFKYIDDIEKYAQIINASEKIGDLAYKTLLKFITNYLSESDEEKVETIKKVSNIISSEGVSFFNKVCEGCDEIRTFVADIIVNNIKEFTFNQLMNMLEWLLFIPTANEGKYNIDDIISAMVVMVNNKDQALITVQCINKVSSPVFKAKKDKYISIYSELLRKNYSKDLNKEIIDHAKSRGSAIAKKVIESAPESMYMELNEYFKQKK